MSFIIAFLCAIKDAIAYRFRGMNFGGGIWANRLLWGGALSSTYALTHLASINWIYLGLIFVLAYLDMFIPHGFAMCAGHRTQKWDDMARIPFIVIPSWGINVTLPKWWPALWMAPFKDALPFWLQDALGMATVAAIRAGITFGVFAFFGALNPWPFVIAIIGQPLSYAGSWKTPWAIPNFAVAYGAEWGEVYTGFVWGLAMGALS